jgi:poly-gamma-glutamate synthesis protein (capsule biosynthesis protein)
MKNFKYSKRLFMKERFVLVATTFVLAFTGANVKANINTAYAKPIEQVTDEEIKTVNLIAVGDNLINGVVYENGEQEDGSYNFDSFFKNIQDELNWADVKVINQETILVKNAKDYSGYPTFGSPYAIGDAIAKAGFNVVSHATNHTYDKGLKGIDQTFSFWKKYDQITILGIHKNKEDYSNIKVIEVNGIKIALLNYTYSLNGFKLPKGSEYLVDTLDDEKKVIKDIKKAETLGDLTIVFPHWGTEYVYDETSFQKNYAKLMADAGADLIIGAHPHVVEPLKYITTKDKRNVPVYYSLGNFISNQDQDPRMLGAMAQVVITEKNGKISLDCKIMPLVTHQEYDKPYTAYMLEDYTDKLGRKHRRGLSLKYLYDLWNDIVEDKDEVKPKSYIKK